MRLAAVIGPAFFIAILFVASLLLVDVVPLPLLVSAAVLTVAAAAVASSWVIFHVMERGERQLRERNRQLAAVQAAATDLASERDQSALLGRFV